MVIFDLQAVLPVLLEMLHLSLNVSKFNVLNFTLYDIERHQSTSFLWHEGEEQRGVNGIGSFIFEYVNNLDGANQNNEFNFYSDNIAPGKIKINSELAATAKMKKAAFMPLLEKQ